MNTTTVTLGVNIDHIATLRNARGTKYPDPIDAAVLAQLAGADQVTVHLREDRRHIVDRDVKLLKEILQIPLNLEIANTKEMLNFALAIKPHMVTLVPEKREERTTEGGLFLKKYFAEIKQTVGALSEQGILVSLFIEPSEQDILLTQQTGAPMVEIHTGKYANLKEQTKPWLDELNHITKACAYATNLNLIVHAGHGLHYNNVRPIAQIPAMHDLNIGHSIISRAALVGLERAICEMRQAMGIISGS